MVRSRSSPTKAWIAAALVLGTRALFAQDPNEPSDDPLAARQYFAQSRSSTGTVSTSVYDDAFTQILSLPQYSTPSNTTYPPPGNGTPPPPPPTSGWNSLGPDNVGGRTRAVVVHPMYASNGAIYAAGADGGVWLSKIVNNTRQWSPLDMGIPTNIAVNSLAVVAPDSNTNDDIL
jgi:hypothetical protein